jgi:hypothetical protein
LCSGGGSAYLQVSPQFRQTLALCRAAQKAVVPDAHKGFGQDVLRKPPNELLLRKLHAPLPPLRAVVFVAKTHLSLSNSLETIVADSNFMGVPPQIFHYLPRTAKRRQWDFYYIMTKRSIQHASMEVGIIFTTYNLRRILNILNKNLLKAYLKAFGFYFLSFQRPFKVILALDFVAIGRIAFY